MCGIAGAIDLKGQRIFPEDRLRRMTQAIHHRGPDDEHVHIEPGVALGACRLAIIDLDHGRQPISNERGNVWVAFNGELFDYPELRAQLLSRGHQLKTRCDTEAWVHLYEDYAEAVFDHTYGQFAVSLWDRERRTLLLGRDRVGICPLYYTESDGWLLWGSEVKALLASGMVEVRPDRRALNHFFTFFSAPTNRSFFEGISLLSPGQFLKICDGRIEQRQYWDLTFPDAGHERRFDDPNVARDELESRLQHAVERRLRSDVPVVCYISGGLDSTVTLTLCCAQRSEPVPSFTIGFDGAGPDERWAATESANVLGSPLSTLTFTPAELAMAQPELVRAAEGPVMDTSCACLMRLAGLVHQKGYKVALTGEGADEALAGYVWFRSAKFGRKLERVLPFMPPLMQRIALRTIGGGDAHRPPHAAMAGTRPVQQDIAELLCQTRETLFAPAMWDALADHCPFAALDLTNDNIARWHPLNQSLYVGYKVMLPGLLMTAKGDRVAMNSSVETRYPYLDNDVIEFCAGIDPELKLRKYTGKWLLREVAAKVLPRQIARRPKTMFRAKLAEAFCGPSGPEWVAQLLSPESIARTGYFDHEGIEQFKRRLAGHRLSTARPFLDMGLMCTISTQLWHHTYCGGGLCDLPTYSGPS